jgi:hypothetical protein
LTLEELLAASTRVQFRSVQTQNRYIVPWLVLAEAVGDEVRELSACLRVADSGGLILSSPEGFLEFYNTDGRLATVDWLPEEHLRCREHWEDDARLADGGQGLLGWLEAELRKLHWTFCFTHDQEWSSRPTLQLGPPSSGTPWAYLLVSRGEQPWLRVCLDLEELEGAAFEECLVWNSALWVGYGERVYRIDLHWAEITEVPVPFYFGSFYPLEDSMLVCSGTHLLRLDARGQLLWTSTELAADGILINELCDGVLEGQAECDPPDGWVPFRLELASGRLLD